MVVHPSAAQRSRDPRARRCPVALVLAGLLITACAGCAAPDAQAGDAVPEVTSAPIPVDVTSPESAVRSYLERISFAYRVLDSSVASSTVTIAESVRVDAYVQLNAMEGRGLDQRVEELAITSVSREETSAIVTAREEWAYRYFSLETLTYLSEVLTASYETTYTLVLEDGAWLVDRVDARPLGEIR